MGVLFYVIGLFSTLIVLSSAQITVNNRIRLNNTVPHHYNVELTLNVQTKSFAIGESIEVTILQDTNTIEINSHNIRGDWLNTRLVAENGSEFKPNFVVEMYDEVSEVMHIYFEEAVIVGNYTLHLTGITGVFGSGIVEVPLPDTSKYLLSTGYNLTNLRNVFPCFDQPDYKATFKFTINYPAAYVLISNLADVTTSEPYLVNGVYYLRTAMEYNIPISTHSIAFMLTNMDAATSSDNRVRVYHTDSATREYLRDIYHNNLLEVERQLDVTLEFPKLDIVFVPNLPTKTQPNWGMIRVNLSPVLNSVLHSIELRDIQREILRSVYQLYFGELLSVEWWEDRYILYGLARLFTAWNFDTEEEFIVNTVQRVIREDSNLKWMKESIALTRTINTINELVVDHKAGAVLRMVSNWIGRDNFTGAVVDYLSANKYMGITGEHFYSHLDNYVQQSLIPVGYRIYDIIKNYERQTTQIYSSTVNVTLNDNEFLISRDDWMNDIDIPVDFMTPSKPAASKPQLWLLDSESNVAQTVQPNESWIVVNPEQFGLYRVKYDNSILNELANQLLVNHTKIGHRGQLIADSAYLAIDLQARVDRHLNLIQYLTNETDKWVWRTAGQSYEDMSIYLRGIEEQERLEYYYANLVAKEYMRYRIQLNCSDIERTMDVAKIACFSNHETCVKDAEDYLNTTITTGVGLTGSDDFQYLIYCTLARYSTNQDRLFTNLMEVLAQSFTSIAVNGLGCASDPEIINQFLQIAATNLLNELGIHLSSSERLSIFHVFLHGSYEATLHTLEYILQHYIMINSQLGTMDELFVGVGEYVRTSQQLSVLNEILATHSQRMTSSVRAIIMHEYATGNMNRNRLYAIKDGVNSWLKENVDLPGHGNLLYKQNVIILSSVVVIMITFVNQWLLN